jgi:hypothetical protein
MITRTKDNTRKTRKLDHHACLIYLDTEPTIFANANTHPKCRAAMAYEITALAQN